jgi:hypothetical protein
MGFDMHAAVVALWFCKGDPSTAANLLLEGLVPFDIVPEGREEEFLSGLWELSKNASRMRRLIAMNRVQVPVKQGDPIYVEFLTFKILMEYMRRIGLDPEQEESS